MFKLLFMVGGFFAGKLYAENGNSFTAIALKVQRQITNERTKARIADMKL